MALTGKAKSNEWRRAVGAICGVTGGVVLVSSIAYLSIFQSTNAWLAYGPLAFSVVLLVGALTFFAQTIRERMSKRSGVFLSITLVSTLLLLAFLAFLNIAVIRAHPQIDVTSNQVHSLSQQTREMLARLDTDVSITAFYDKDQPEFGKIDDLARSYKRFSKRISFERKSPTADIDAVQAYDVTKSGPRIFVETHKDDAKKRRLARFSIDMQSLNHEEELTNAIMKIEVRQRAKLWVLTGHGEVAVDNAEGEGFSRMRSDLINEGYDVYQVNLIQKQSIPDDVAAVLVLGPRSALLGPETKAISSYLRRGGRVGFFLEPLVNTGLDVLLGTYGIQLGNDMIIDVSPYGRMHNSGPDTAIATTYGEHPITEKFSKSTTVFPQSRSLSINPGTPATHVELVKTSERTWGETNVSDENPEWNEGEVRGPVTLAITAEEARDQKKSRLPLISESSRLLVVGDSSFASNQYRALSGNRNLFLNMIGWLSAQESRIAIRPPTRGANMIVLSSGQREGIAFFTLYFLPVVILVIGLSVWLIRRMR